MKSKGKKHVKRKEKKKKKKKSKWKKLKKGREYYSEGGTYKSNPKFDNWARDLDKIKKKVKTDSSCTCGVSPARNKNNKKKKDSHNRIVNGKEASINKYPWIISMMDGTGYWYCG